MADQVAFQGKVVRVERDGFGIIEFDRAIGANTRGIFSRVISEATVPFRELKPGMHVTGTAEVDEKDLAAVKTLQIESAS